MNRLLSVLLLSLSLIFVHPKDGSAQLLDKIRDKAEDKIVEKIFEGESSSRENTSNTRGNNNNYQSKSSKKNTTGGGLSKSDIDVGSSISAAENYYKEQNFGRARSAVRDAIMAIELEIGENILASLPESVEGLSSNPGRDNVTSTGIGFVGLTIERVYEGPEKELTFTVANNSALYSTVNMYLVAGNYGSNTEQEYKKIDYKGYDAVIEYDDYKGYTLNVPFGQSSLVVINGINYATEEDFMVATRNFNIEKIKSELGEK